MISYVFILLTAIVVSGSSSLLGSLLLLRKQILLVDAISHAILPGLVVGYLITATKSSSVMIVGATACGFLATLLIEKLSQVRTLHADAAMGVVFTVLFSLGVLLISQPWLNIDLDQDCVLFGEMAYVPFHHLFLGGLDIGPRGLWMAVLVLGLITVFCYRGRKELPMVLFNPEYARTMGISVAFWQYGIAFLTAFSTVIHFELVGSIVVVALVVIPPSAAFLFAKSFPALLRLSLCLAIISSMAGFGISWLVNGSVGGGIASASFGVFLVCLVIYRMQRKKRSQVHMNNYATAGAQINM
ncbi:MAG TPA: metal ABC transporter permease [Luteibaculaceae bacterium]|nr:metal ABC transporter permease [Luteibaculaceae bacterium]